MRIISVMNQKGGCGKTTIAIHLSSALARLDRRILLIDLDPQSHATVGLGLRDEVYEATSYELLIDPATGVTETTRTVRDNLDIIPSNTVLAGIEQELADRTGREERLSTKLSKIDDEDYDFIIIDCPPSIGLLTFNALVASQEVLIPVDASYFATHGLIKLRETLDVLNEELQHQLKVHVVCNNLETRTSFARELLDEIDKFHSAVLLDTFISHTVRLKEAASLGKSIFDISNASKAARQFYSLGRELVEKKPRIDTKHLNEWMDRLQGPERIPEGVLFVLDAPGAESVSVTGEFTNWSREGAAMGKDPGDGLWKVVLDIDPGEYEYRFIVDGKWIRDPNNKDYIRNEFGQENSLLII